MLDAWGPYRTPSVVMKCSTLLGLANECSGLGYVSQTKQHRTIEYVHFMRGWRALIATAGWTLKAVRKDNAPELDSDKFEIEMNQDAVRVQPPTAYTPQRQGKIESIWGLAERNAVEGGDDAAPSQSTRRCVLHARHAACNHNPQRAQAARPRSVEITDRLRRDHWVNIALCNLVIPTRPAAQLRRTSGTTARRCTSLSSSRTRCMHAIALRLNRAAYTHHRWSITSRRIRTQED